ncbi:hypothetical protein D3C87_1196240 [compost metagenome]
MYLKYFASLVASDASNTIAWLLVPVTVPDISAQPTFFTGRAAGIDVERTDKKGRSTV